jgi:hypothetical protein
LLVTDDLLPVLRSEGGWHKMNCPSCGAVAAPGDAYCDECGNPLANEAHSAQAVRPPATATETDGASANAIKRTLSETPILLGDGETVWRQYRVAQLRTRDHGEGTLYVTDARVVFFARAKGRGSQRPSALVQETKLEHITGLTAYVSRRISLALFVLTFLLGLLTVFALVARSWVLAIVLAALTAGAVAILLEGAAKRGSVGVMIHSGATQASPISFGQFGEQRGFFGNLFHTLLQPFLGLFGVFTAFDVLLGFPGQDSEQVIAELGALISDLQTRGNLAATHWGVESA